MTKMETLRAAVEEQLKGVAEVDNLCEAAWDLLDAVKTEDEATLVLEDFASGRSIKDAEKAVHDWCDKNRKTARVVGCPRWRAHAVIRAAFGLPVEAGAGKPPALACDAAPVPSTAGGAGADNVINLFDLL